MDSYGGRPHWGKRHYQSAATLRDRYPLWDDVSQAAARDRASDPDGRRSTQRLHVDARCSAG